MHHSSSVFVTVTVAILLLVVLGVFGDAANPRHSPKRILFVGNSMTYVGDLPKVLVKMAEEHNEVGKVAVDMEAPGGFTLQQHWESGKPQKMMDTGHYDAVVIQGQSTESLDDLEPFKTYGGKLAAMALKHKAVPYFFSTWSCCTPFACSKESLADDQKTLDSDYAGLAKSSNGILVPVGAAWSAYRSKHPKPIGVLTTDNAHPNAQGAYLNACVFFETLFGLSSVGMRGPTGVSAADAKELQEIAHSVVNQHRR